MVKTPSAKLIEGWRNEMASIRHHVDFSSPASINDGLNDLDRLAQNISGRSPSAQLALLSQDVDNLSQELQQAYQNIEDEIECWYDDSQGEGYAELDPD